MGERIVQLIEEDNFTDQDSYLEDFWIVRLSIDQLGYILLIPAEIAEKEKKSREMWDIVAARILAKNFPDHSGRKTWNRLTKKIKVEEK